MSRIGRKPITVPAGVEVKIDGHTVTVKGPKGTLTRTLNEEIGIQMEGNEILVTRPNDDIKNRSLHGLNRTLIHNMVVGVTEGFEKKLEIQGVGYNARQEPEAGSRLLPSGYRNSTGRHHHFHPVFCCYRGIWLR